MRLKLILFILLLHYIKKAKTTISNKALFLNQNNLYKKKIMYNVYEIIIFSFFYYGHYPKKILLLFKLLSPEFKLLLLFMFIKLLLFCSLFSSAK